MEGDVAAYKALLDSGYGTAKDTVDINTIMLVLTLTK